MITLKDYIGKIYKEVTNAKVQSDIETLAIAQEYVENPMLKHFAVPNIRIKDMQLTIPVAVDTTQTVARSYTESEVQKVYEDAFTKVTTDSLADRADEHNAYLQSIQPELATKAQVEATATVSRLQQAEATAAPEGESADGTTSAEYANALNISANKFVDVSFGFLTDLNIEEPVFRTAMVQEIEQNLQPRTPEIQDLPVIVETQRLEAINDPTNLISIKINITDDAMEWTTDVDENGNTVQRLDYL
ncbi:hypothetical protein C8N46_101631 [Kordia periserrulae]|uniref:Uncharacterized protein n=1 Tax=Kordia periserrulae TaxID=701523 RepID=A0A2T6C6R7_9FLAO|nr:hypothetical protein [Kordia periserrulae]PTX64021.1 hypothetical protein C8N46_101631 [Kordia periserrulae]